MSSSPERRFKPEPIETTTRSARRFAPQPVETTARSSRQPPAEPEDKPARRRFVPQPIEVSTTSSRGKAAAPDDIAYAANTSRRKFQPQLVEQTEQKRRRNPDNHGPRTEPVEQDGPSKQTPSVGEDSSARRKFAPVLLETAARSRRAGDKQPLLLPSDEPDAPPSSLPPLTLLKSPFAPQPPLNTPTSDLPDILPPKEARRLGIPLPSRQLSLERPRSHSFRLPELDTIESSESDESVISTSPSSPSESSPDIQTAGSGRQDSQGRDSSGNILELAAKAAERQLREQALAAFPNDDRHTPVDHFIDRDEASRLPSRKATGFRRDSGLMKTDLQYLEMQRHQQKRQAQKDKEAQEREARRKRAVPRLQEDPWADPYLSGVRGNLEMFGGFKKDNELEPMRRKARPPMLGRDLKFARCQSPEPARFDPTQGALVIRNSVEHLGDQPGSSQHLRPECGLWKSPNKQTSCRGSVWSHASSSSPSSAGLWGGFCHESASNPHPNSGPTGIMTPRVDPDDNIAAGHFMMRQLPPSPPPSNSGIASLDEKLELEQALDDEFGDAFVTQVYNYLSLGYPSLARRYDEELSKISSIPVSVLRQDDHLPSARGYIRLGEQERVEGENVTEYQCARWKALKLYIHEWARQQPFMVPSNGLQGGFGVTVRRGSWAW